MELTPKTKLNDLLKKYPFLLESLTKLSPSFEKLKNRALRNTVGRVASLSQAARLGDVPLEKLLREMAGEINRVRNERVTVSLLGAEEEEPLTREARLEILKDIIRDLHRGEDMDKLKKRFAALIKDIRPAEISEMEQRLIQEGMPAEEVTRLCDVHVQVFKESLDTQPLPSALPGHPLHTLMAENRALENIVSRVEELLGRLGSPVREENLASVKPELLAELGHLGQLEKHFLKKENQLFPILESKGVGGPSKVMWAVDNDIRAHLKETIKALEAGRAETGAKRGAQTLIEIRDMIYKEEKILFPMSLEVLGQEDWERVKQGEEEIGTAWISPGTGGKPAPTAVSAPPAKRPYEKPVSRLPLDVGALTLEQVNLLLRHLPVDVTLVDEEDKVVFYSDTKDRIFPRSRAIIGRRVQDCHPPASLSVVNRILEAFRGGTRDVAEFWLQLDGRFIHIRYFAVREEGGAYRGCLEVSQDITGLKRLEGESRLLDWK